MMAYQPTFDVDGDISEDSYRRIEKWDHSDGYLALLDFLDICWRHDYGRIIREGRRWTFITGGWSGNEAIVGAMLCNDLFHAVCWKSSERGGRHVFEVPETLK